ncbi:hypothetical protein A33M_0063 [Rhodovulum sp. PH10]|uniref:DUF2189 domain-containing protein n=1 Tax=Rhodovulum sp. PH10 TaxID=1187851 RepID=UPI00027C26F8|nr:DUF2189 domain-containing protein [Rhodovulum sp. PH10]EJW13733.1 hypothetical protein A33M_0063 [Rhodovulum sp. PH10]
MSHQDSADHNAETPPSVLRRDPRVRSVSVRDIVEALAAGLRDFQSAPLYGLAFGAVYAGGGLLIVLSALAAGVGYLAYPLAAGFALIGPFVAVGLYEVSRRREVGDPLRWRLVLGTVLEQRNRELGWMAFVTLFVFVVWMYQVRLLIVLMLGLRSFTSLQEFLVVVTTTPEGWLFLLIGHVVGAALALVLYALTVVSFPLLLDREVDFITAMITSVRAVVASPKPMIGWAAVIVLLLVVACLPGFLGLLLVLPILGHATWHLYRRIVVTDSPAAPFPAPGKPPSPPE